MSTLYWVIAGVLIYLGIVFALKRTDSVPDFVKVGKTGLLLTFHTKHGKQFIERVSQSRIWKPVGTLGVIIASFVMVVTYAVVAESTRISVFSDVQTNPQVTEPQNVLLVPGINDFLPLSIAPELILGVAIGVIVHEGGHAILCRVENIEIDSMGVIFLSFLPLGAFVEPDPKSEKEATVLGRLRMLSGGVLNNFIIALVLFALLFGPLIGSIATVDGVHVGGSIDNDEGIMPGDVIVGLDGEEINSISDYYQEARQNGNQEVTVNTLDGDDKTIERNLFTTSVRDSSFDIQPQTEIESVNGESVSTQAGMYDALRSNDADTTITDSDGNTYTGVSGVFATSVNPDGELSNDGVPTNTDVIVTQINNERVVHETEYVNTIDELSGSDDVDITLYYEGSYHEHTVSVTSEGIGLSGIQSGFSGINVDDMGVDFYPSDYFITQFGGESVDGYGFIDKMFFSIIAPLVSALGAGVNYNFFGFTGVMTNFYTVTGPLSVLGDKVVFTLFNLTFWSAWINIQLGVFNCLPAYPLDGGRILQNLIRGGMEMVGLDDYTQIVSKGIVSIVTLSCVVMIGLIIFA